MKKTIKKVKIFQIILTLIISFVEYLLHGVGNDK